MSSSSGKKGTDIHDASPSHSRQFAGFPRKPWRRPKTFSWPKLTPRPLKTFEVYIVPERGHPVTRKRFIGTPASLRVEAR